MVKDGHDHRLGHSNQQVTIESTEMRHDKPVIRYFVSYAHDDKALKDKLLKSLEQHLRAANDYCFKAWDDSEILAGEHWHEQIQAAIAHCQFGLLLVTPAFLGSTYIQGHELGAFVASKDADTEPGKRAIPVALKRILFDGTMDLKGLALLQVFRDRDGKAFEERSTPKTRHDFTSELFQQILKIVKRHGAHGEHPHTPKPEPPKGTGRIDDNGLKQLQIFLAHAKEDKDKIRALYKQLSSEGFKPWLDEIDLLPEQDRQIEIPKAIRNSDVFLACLSDTAVNKTGYIQEELRLALVERSKRPINQVFLIPVKLEKCDVPPIELPELGIKFTDYQWINLLEGSGFKQLVKAIRTQKKASPTFGTANQPGHPLKRDIWLQLEKAARDIAVTAGFNAMSYYRNALAESGAMTEKPNPSTLADQYATIAILQTLYTIHPLASRLSYSYRVLAEELDDPEVAPHILEKLQSGPTFSNENIKKSTKEFREGWEHSLSILVDPIDGTANFDAGLPFFCSAVAFFVEGRLSVGAIYDPFHNQVFYGSLRTLDDGSSEPISEPIANMWTISAGVVEDLRRRNHQATKRSLIAAHLTRSNETVRARFLKFLPHLYEDRDINGGTYMLNSGQMALAHVACGNLHAFINNTTKIWDVAAGEVLIRAIGGQVTDFKGRDINYGESTDISVLACETPNLHEKLLNIIDKHYPWTS